MYTSTNHTRSYEIRRIREFYSRLYVFQHAQKPDKTTHALYVTQKRVTKKNGIDEKRMLRFAFMTHMSFWSRKSVLTKYVTVGKQASSEAKTTLASTTQRERLLVLHGHAWENHECAVYHTKTCDKNQRFRGKSYIKVCFHDAYIVFVSEEGVDKVRDRGKASVFRNIDNACINHPTRTTTRITRTRLREPRMRCKSHKDVC